MNLVNWAITVALFLCEVLVECGDLIPDRTCVTLFSEANFKGESFKLKDFDQSVSLRREYRYSLDGWESTGSVSLENGCTANLCSMPYFMGTCQTLTVSQPDSKTLGFSVTSANCTCTRTCSCEDIVIPSDYKSNGFLGRAYLEGGCDTCDAEYINLQKKKDVPKGLENSVTAFVLPKGCSLTIYPEAENKGEPVTVIGPVYQDFEGTIVSHSYDCDEVEDEGHELDENHPPMLDLPLLKLDVFEQTAGNETLESHPGVKIVLESIRNSRSAKHAYIIFIGARVPYWLGFPQCKGKSSDAIWECRMKARMPHIGLEGELRLIVVPVGYNTSFPVYRHLMATVDSFMSSHEELKEVIPNAVIVYHWISDSAKNISTEGGIFQRKLSALHTLRNRLLDESYPNVVFLLDDLDGLDDIEERQPDGRISYFDKEITERWSFPSPVNFVIRSDALNYTRFVNGYQRLENMEYWPRNLEVSLVTMCEKGEDPLGAEILKAVFKDREASHWYAEQLTHNITVNASMLNHFRDAGNMSLVKVQIEGAMAQARWEARKAEGDLHKEIQRLKANMTAEIHSRCGTGSAAEKDKALERRIWERLMSKLKPILE